MLRDWNIIRDLVLNMAGVKIEGRPAYTTCEESVYDYHLWLISDLCFDRHVPYDEFTSEMMLSSKGQDFLALIESQDVWNSTMEAIELSGLRSVTYRDLVDLLRERTRDGIRSN